MELIKKLEKARARSVPLVGISTVDQLACVQAIRTAKNGGGRVLFNGPIVQWDLVEGWRGLNEAGAAEVGAMLSRTGGESAALVVANPVDSLREAAKLGDGSLLIGMNFHRVIDGDGVSQGIQNLRAEYAATQRMLIMLGPDLRVPGELTQDVVLMSEELPSREVITGIITGLLTENNLPVVESQVTQASDALVGLAAFSAEQAAAMSLNKSGLDVASCWDLKRAVIEQTQGLQMEFGGPTFADIGGLESAVDFAKRIAHTVKCIARVDELEKLLGGAGASGIGDSSGVSQDALGVILRSMEDNGWRGLIAVGPPGSGKTLFSTAFGATVGVPTIAVDLGAAKGSLVGQSETQIRALCKTVKAIGGAGVYWIATCNQLEALPAALKRRFTSGVWFFDLPSEAERALIWDLQCKARGVKNQNRPVDSDWSGAEIRNCVQLAADTGMSLVEAAEFQVPVCVSDPESIKRLRSLAAGRFKSASYKGPYRAPGAVVGGRKLNLEGGE